MNRDSQVVSPGRRGFSLVEVVIVVGIIALLIAMLMPTVGRVREQSKATVCLSNLRQLGTALTIYVDAHRGAFPLNAHAGAGQSWVETLYPYGVTPAVRFCPSDERDATTLATSYLTNNYTVAPRPYTKITMIRRASATIYAAETHKSGDHLHATGYTTPESVADEIAIDRHAGKASYLFCDGHADWIPADRLRSTFTLETSPFNPATAR
jgi:prepilin-type processing-associated H-X9-DG protein/prepilin-type N-terminal cleavage/methylation domain-containing protein